MSIKQSQEASCWLCERSKYSPVCLAIPTIFHDLVIDCGANSTFFSARQTTALGHYEDDVLHTPP